MKDFTCPAREPTILEWKRRAEAAEADVLLERQALAILQDNRDDHEKEYANLLRAAESRAAALGEEMTRQMRNSTAFMESAAKALATQGTVVQTLREERDAMRAALKVALEDLDAEGRTPSRCGVARDIERALIDSKP